MAPEPPAAADKPPTMRGPSGASIGSIRGITRHCPLDRPGETIGNADSTKVRHWFAGDPKKLSDDLLTALALERRVTGQRTKNVAPSPYRSEATVGLWPARISGAVKAGVPMTFPVSV